MLLGRWRREDLEFEASTSKVSNTLSQKKKKGLRLAIVGERVQKFTIGAGNVVQW
jgi:hypothetical protein